MTIFLLKVQTRTQLNAYGNPQVAAHDYVRPAPANPAAPDFAGILDG